MKTKLLLTTLLFSVLSWGQSIFENQITGTNPNSSNPYTIGQTFNANITVSGIGRGSGITGSNANDRYNANNWNSATLDNTKYFEFVLTPNSGFKINFISFSYTGQASGTGATSFAFRSSVDGFTANIGTPSVSGTTVNLSAGVYQNITTPITFRFYGWNASSSGGTFSLNDFVFNGSVISACTPPTIASIFPLNGPVGTEVTITASSGSLLSATATLSGVTMPVVSSTATQLVALVPTGTSNSTGNLVISDIQPCTTSATFTVSKKSGSCGTLSSLIMTEIFDNPSGSLGYIEIYNGTGATVDLTTYYIRRYGDNADFVANNFTDFTFAPSVTSIASGAVIYGRISSDANIISPNFDYGNSAGINGDDILHLYNGATLIDVYVVPNNTVGYSALRNLSTAGPNTTSNPADWTHTNTPSTSNLGSFPYVASGGSPTINTNPTTVTSCGNTASFNVTATPSGSGSLTYQWYFNNGATTNWTALNASSFSGVTITGFVSNTLNLSGNIASVNGYQFYCIVTQDATCNVYSNAAQLKIQSTIWNGTAWSNGVPSTSRLAIINGNYNTTTNGSFECCSLVINSGFVVNINASEFVLIQNDLTVNGVLNVNNNGSLIQVNDTGSNTGAIAYQRTASLRLDDYVYWSSPVVGYNVNSISPSTPTGFIYKWNPTFSNPNGGLGYWVGAASNTMIPGGGYIVKGPSTFNNTSAQSLTATFSGTPNNGVITTSISRGGFTAPDYTGANGTTITRFDDNWNLVGNPYPSSINILDFLSLNTNIEGAVRIWTHGNLPSTAAADPFYDDYASNYTPNDYITHNGTGTVSGLVGFNGFVSGGQGFMVLMNDGAATSQTITFNNSMRNKTYNNSQFYRSASVSEKNRIWLDVTNENNVSDRTLIGYIEGATDNKDRMYDAYTKVEPNIQRIYSFVDSDKLTIQGFGLPFSENDQINIGVNLPTVGKYAISIHAVDGLFQNQSVFIEDAVTGSTHNITSQPYHFSSDMGEINTRFKLVFKDSNLSNDEVSAIENVVFITNLSNIEVNSTNELINQIDLYDVLGRTLINKNDINSNQFVIDSILKTNSVILIQVHLANGQIITKKIMH